jgi:protocatechuate 3,4-dioxygenase beta subunit
MTSRHALVLTSILLFLGTGGGAFAQNRGDCQGREAEGWSVTIAGPDEPGQRLVVEGRVVLDNGDTPVPGATVFVFHTDAEGFYSPAGMEESNARLCGMMLTDEQGRYRFETIRPAHYATGGGPPAHIHYRVWGDGVPRQSFSLQFEGDPYLGERGRDASDSPAWATIRPVEEASDGTQRVTRDLKIR